MLFCGSRYDRQRSRPRNLGGVFVYWFRYACLLMLQTKPVVDHTSEVVAANGLSLPDVLTCLQEQVGYAQLAALQESLDRDYRLLTRWLSRSAKLQAGGCALKTGTQAGPWGVLAGR
jgi:hypothetical protein